ncbi:hypothetical protein PUN28_015654 [Cardiocondyla obscurior]|uniref:Uncharacterized protein n=1 Tax=Cardiocondyla obscurior TaxID=286306 RepID=A0AAW2EU58_9HYME
MEKFQSESQCHTWQIVIPAIESALSTTVELVCEKSDKLFSPPVLDWPLSQRIKRYQKGILEVINHVRR